MHATCAHVTLEARSDHQNVYCYSSKQLKTIPLYGLEEPNLGTLEEYQVLLTDESSIRNHHMALYLDLPQNTFPYNTHSPLLMIKKNV